MKQVWLFLVTLLCATSYAQAGGPLPQNSDEWFKAGQATLRERLARRPNVRRAKNVILFIADGNGIANNYATRLFDGQRKGMLGSENILAYERLPHLALSKTYNSNAQTPDSSGTATAINTGVKTKLGVVGVDETLAVGKCDQVKGALVRNFAEIVAKAGKSVGIVTTSGVTHATPASAYAHTAARNFENDSRQSKSCNVPDIARQLIDKIQSGEITVAMGGGRQHFLPRTVKDKSGVKGSRKDGQNLIQSAQAHGAQYAWDRKSLKKLRLNRGSAILGLFASNHMRYEHDRRKEPSLAEMTEAAITALSNNDRGFYLMVEGARIDHANHSGKLYRAVTDGVAFAEAYERAMAMVSLDDTLVIVTADHGAGLTFTGHCGRGSPVTGLCYGISRKHRRHSGNPLKGRDGKPFTVALYANGPGSVLKKDSDGGYSGARPNLTNDEAMRPNYRQQALIPRVAGTHSGLDVAIYAGGPWAHLLNGTVEQNYIFHVMNYAINPQ